MRAKTIPAFCCFLTLLLTGAVLSAEPAPALANPALDSGAAAPVCAAAAPAAQNAGSELGLGPVTNSACPANVWQACFQRYGTCTLCFCIGSSCECENRCV